uniref:Uncharacterized protein n=1 Tax=viral metagenome TaxID=1070528 RepID=A0A6M3XD97_9ZZZZ
MNIKELILKYDILKKKNVIGYSLTLKSKIRDGQIIPERPCVRIYVTKKELKETLMIKDIIPVSLGDVETDIIEVGEIKALSIDKTSRIRPVPLGVSISNWNITAGSLGMLYKNKYGTILAGSNAHVLTEFPEKNPEEQNEKRILQPGSYHAGQNLDNIIGTYLWHKRIVPLGESNCNIGTVLASFFNIFIRVLRRNGRFRYISDLENNIDFGVYLPSTDHILEVADSSLTNEPFVGHLFAGSNTQGIICKVKYIISEDYIPLVDPAEVQIGDIVKGCSFWCNYQTRVIDESAVIQVNYGNFIITYSDVIIVNNDGTIKGGWSGSGFRKIA